MSGPAGDYAGDTVLSQVGCEPTNPQMNPYESPRTPANSSAAISRRLDRGVLFLALVMLIGCLISIVGFASAAVRDFLMPRFGWIGLLLSLNALIFIGFWIKKPSRRGLLAASFMTCAIGVINGVALLQTGTVDVVQNAFHDRVHSAWLWSVFSYLSVGGYFAFAAIRHRGVPLDQGERITAS